MTDTQVGLILFKKNKLLVYVTKWLKGLGYCWIKDSYALSPPVSSSLEVSASLCLIACFFYAVGNVATPHLGL